MPNLPAAEARRAAYTNQGRAFTEVTPGSIAPTIDFSGIDTQWLDYQKTGQGPLSREQLQQQLDQLYQQGGPIANDDWRLAGGVPPEFDPNTGKPYGVGDLVSNTSLSIGYWEKVPDPRQAGKQPVGRLAAAAEAAKFIQAGGTPEQWRGLSVDQQQQASADIVNEEQARVNEKWVAQKKKGGFWNYFTPLAKTAVGFGLGALAATPGLLASWGAEYAPNLTGWANTNLPDILNPLSGDPTSFAIDPATAAARETGFAGLGTAAYDYAPGNLASIASGVGPAAGTAAPITGVSSAALPGSTSGVPFQQPGAAPGTTLATTAAGAPGGAPVTYKGLTAAQQAQLAGPGVSFGGTYTGPAGAAAATTAAKAAVGAGATAAGVGAAGGGGVGFLSTAADLLVGGASIYGAVQGVSAAKKAASAQVQGIEASTQLLRDIYEQSRADIEPYREAGVGALGRLEDISRGDFSGFETSPGYEFRLAEGQKAQERSAAARGGLLSGRGVKELERFAQGTASGEFANYWNRQAGLAGVGQTATGQTVQAGQAFGAQAGQNLQQAGTARASGYVGASNVISDSITQALYARAFA